MRTRLSATVTSFALLGATGLALAPAADAATPKPLAQAVTVKDGLTIKLRCPAGTQASVSYSITQASPYAEGSSFRDRNVRCSGAVDISSFSLITPQCGCSTPPVLREGSAIAQVTLTLASGEKVSSRRTIWIR